MRNLTLSLFALTLAGCAAPSNSRTYSVRSDGSTVAGVRSAADGVPGEGGPQEIIGLYIPLGPFAVKSAVLWDGNPLVVAPPIGFAAPAAASVQTVDVEETYQEPVTTFVTKTRMVKKAVVPIPQAAPSPCAK